ncbi:aldose epimerase family protein [Gallaecimonas xiamenensis]|uniref:Aldose 1-epimerase n=1 Tax=Gallaecimonas xiamenensis 3-C-1 TaxID=745411 RepID=K2JPD4_9GAMM|nr:aldose epimerase family protein [Gallaecimonas xiamenensis]EKE72329.1 aldose 1-epimerase [Gallaecimonas xiamenensis 3-C-1]
MALTLSQKQWVEPAFHRPVNLYQLGNSHGLSVTLADFGAAVWSIKAPGRDGIKDVTLNYQDKAQWLSNPYYFGVIVGRCANRIGQGRFALNDKSYQLDRNDGANHLHGGAKGLSTRFWDSWSWQLADRVGVTFVIASDDGDQGYPGNFKAQVSYSLNDAGELAIDYSAEADQDGPINLTSHSYFNLAGRGDVLGQELTLAANHYLAVDGGLIPTGALLAVAGTAMDFRRPKAIGLELEALPGGYDHFWVARDHKVAEPLLLATLRDPKSGRTLELLSTEPGVQFYSGNFLDGSLKGEQGDALIRHGGICLEPHIHPDAVNHPGFPSTLIKAHQPYRQRSLYRFSVT